MRHGKLKKTQLREATNGWLHPWIHLAFRCQTKCRKVILHSNLSRRKYLANWDVLHHDTSNSNGWAAENNTQGLAEQMKNSKRSNTEVSTNIRFTNLWEVVFTNQFSERHGKQYRVMVFEGELSFKFHAKDVKIGTSSDRNPGQDQVTIGRAHRPGSTND